MQLKLQQTGEGEVQRQKTGPIQLREHTPAEKQAGIKVVAPPLDSHCEGPVIYPGDIKKNTHKILKRKKRTNTQCDYTARFDGQRFGKQQAATWNARGIAEKTELLKRKTDIAIITETKKKNKGSEDIGNYVMICCGVLANQWASSGVAVVIRKDWKHKKQDYTWISDRIIETKIRVLYRNFTIGE